MLRSYLWAPVAVSGLALFAEPAAAQSASTPDCDLPAGNYVMVFTVKQSCEKFVSTTQEDFAEKLNAIIDLKTPLAINYTNITPAGINVRFNGVLGTLRFVDATRTLTVNIPDLDYTKTFTGFDRFESIQLFWDELATTDLLERINRQQAASSPTSPITGVGGLIPTIVSQEFNQNFTDSATSIAAPKATAASGANINLIGASLLYGSFTTKDENGLESDVKVKTLPLSYTFRNDIDPRRQLALNAYITQVDISGASLTSGGVGVSYRFPMNDNWTLVPSARLSSLKSDDLATDAGASAASVTSVYVWQAGKFNVAMGNMLSYNSSVKLGSGQYASDPGITNTSLRNGLLFSQPVRLGGKRLSMEYSLVDTRCVSGTKPYVDNYQEVGVTVGTNKDAFSSRSFVRGGVTFVNGRGNRGFTLNIGYWF
jgi:hypothetical protein